MTIPEPFPPQNGRDRYAHEMRNVKRLGRLLMLLTALLSVVLVLYAWPIVRDRLVGPDASPRAITPRGALNDYEKSTIALFKKASPSVVYITTDALRPNRQTRRMQEVPEGEGSGFVWNEQGYVVTNFHVIEGASAAHVILYDQTRYDAKIVGSSPDHDLAVLKISVPVGVRLVPIAVGTTKDLEVGQSVLAIGNPFGLDQTLTTGVISALNRSIPGAGGYQIEDVVQTDAAINPGNSGGPLLDSAGRLIGVNTAIYSPSGASAGIGFAIPVDTANRVVPQIIRSGKVNRARIGFVYNESMSARMLPAQDVQGLIVEGVVKGSPAEKAGLKPYAMGSNGVVLGDVVTALNGRPVKSGADVFSVMDKVVPGETVRLTLWRAGKLREVEVKTGE